MMPIDTTTKEGQLLLALIMFGPPILGFGGMLLVTTIDSAKRRWNGRTHIPTGAYSAMRNIQTLLLLLAVLLFAIALVEPSARNDWGGGTQFGWQLFVIGFPYWGINLWFLLAPAILLWLHFAKLPGLQIIPFLVQCGCAFVASNASTFKPEYPGFTQWVIAHWIIAVAYAVPTSLALRSVPRKGSKEALPPIAPIDERLFSHDSTTF